VPGRPDVPPTRRSVTEPSGTSIDRGTVQGANPTANKVRWRYDAAQFGNAVNAADTIETWVGAVRGRLNQVSLPHRVAPQQHSSRRARALRNVSERVEVVHRRTRTEVLRL
jgi:hypothetical protein